MVPSARLAWLHPPPPGETVSALFILCTCLAWGMAVFVCPGKQPGAGLLTTPAPPHPRMQGVGGCISEPGQGVPAKGPQVAHFQTHFSPRCSDSSQPGALLCLTWGAPAFPSWCQEVPSQHPSVLGPFSSPAPHSHTDPASTYLISFSFISLLSG